MVLVIDDEESIRAVTARALQVFGFATLTAADGESGVRALREAVGNVGCVLLDMTMPGMGGRATLSALRGVDPGVRVVLMSGLSRDDAVEQMGAESIAGFLHKPYELTDLKAAVERAMQG
jgi:DNA-binding NtrC family response regulator